VVTLDPERAGLVWIDAQRAVIARWKSGDVVLENLESAVPPRRRAIGSVRRGPARPHGGGRVAGQGTEGRHLELIRRYFTDVAERVADLDVVEVIGRGQPHEQFAAVLRHLAALGDGEPAVTVRRLSRRPSERQMAARLRSMVGQELPRRRSGPYRPPEAAKAASGRIKAPSRDDLRNPTRRHLPEQREIELEVEMMLAGDDPVW
jgi:hypothetical protein